MIIDPNPREKNKTEHKPGFIITICRCGYGVVTG